MTQTEIFSSLQRPSQASPAKQGKASCAYRVIQGPQASEVIDFLASPVASKLAEAEKIVPAQILRCDESGLRVYHLSTAFISYPWEWPSHLWLRAAELTLDICSELLTDRWILKETTPLNITFRGTSPKLANILSVERFSESRPFWHGYLQFVRTFLLPMLAHSQVGRPLWATSLAGKRFDPEEIYDALSRQGS